MGLNKYPCHVAISMIWGTFVGVLLIIRAVLFGVYTRAPDFGKLHVEKNRTRRQRVRRAVMLALWNWMLWCRPGCPTWVVPR